MIKSLKIQPFGCHVVIEKLPREEKTDGGIILPEIRQETHARGKVVAVGQGYRNPDGNFTPPMSKVGETILFNKNSGTIITYKGKDYTVLLDHEIWARELQ